MQSHAPGLSDPSPLTHSWPLFERDHRFDLGGDFRWTGEAVDQALDERLLANGLRRTGPAEQRRTWNLSALWRIPTSEGRIWLKTVPAFFAHEGAVIDWIGEPIAPRLIDFAPGRALISDIPGEPNHDVTDPAELRPMVTLLTNLQHRALDRTDELLALGVPDKRLRTMVGRIPSVVEEWGRDLQPGERTDLDHLLSGLPARLDAIGACGVPDTLVHGDFHPGNVAGTPGAYVILDWGDSFLGHPLIDELAFVRRLDGPFRPSRGAGSSRPGNGSCPAQTPPKPPGCSSRCCRCWPL